MSDKTRITPLPGEMHFIICDKAAIGLGRMLDGNGLKADQVRVKDHDTQVYQLPGVLTTQLKVEITETQLKGKHPHGQVLSTNAEVRPHVEGLIPTFLAAPEVQKEILQLIDKTPEHGFGMDPQKLVLQMTKKEYSVIDICLTCNGAASQPCTPCNATGAVSCHLCHGQGFMSCQFCHGVGQVDQGEAGRAPCHQCQSTGKMQCHTCHGRRQMMCTLCGGHGKNGCLACDQSGSLTHMYHTICRAEMRFELDRKKVPDEILGIVDGFGVKNLAIEQHAEIVRWPQELKDDRMFIDYIGMLPIGDAEFSLEGKIHPATVAGLQGVVVLIDPVMDALVKPGLNALVRISKGPMAVQALVDTACKYRMVREVIAGLAHNSQKVIYQKLLKDYHLILSAKYANAAVRHAAKALFSIGAGPRNKGLALGTLGAVLVSAIYFLSLRPQVLRQMQQTGEAQHMLLADFAVWALGCAFAVFLIKFMEAAAFNKLMPDIVDRKERGLPSAGDQGIAAIFTTLSGWFIAAAAVPMKPEWALHILHTLRIL